MKIVIAPNAFKNCLDALSVAKAIEQGLVNSSLKCECVLFPIGDGGDGTGALLARQLKASIIKCPVKDPLGKMIESQFAITHSKIAIVELADASGLKLIDRNKLQPMVSTTFGTGQLLKNALDH